MKIKPLMSVRIVCVVVVVSPFMMVVSVHDRPCFRAWFIVVAAPVPHAMTIRIMRRKVTLNKTFMFPHPSSLVLPKLHLNTRTL